MKRGEIWLVNTVPWMVVIDPDAGNHLIKPSSIDLFQVRCVAEERLVKRIGAISAALYEPVREAIKIVFGLS